MRCKNEQYCQDMILDDPRCPDEIRALRDTAYANIYIYWSYYAFSQCDTELGQSLLREAVRLKPELIEGKPCEWVIFIVYDSASDGSVEMEAHIEKIFDQLPPEFAALSAQYEWAVSHGYLIKGTQAIIWDRPEEGRYYIDKAVDSGARVDEAFIQSLTRQLLNHQKTFGDQATKEIVNKLVPNLERVDKHAGRRFKGNYLVNQAFQGYHEGKYDQVYSQVIRAITTEPKYLLNRGVLAILFRSSISS
jgi:hypothetical protein